MSSAKIGQRIEADLKDYLELISADKAHIDIFSEDLRLMKSGKQSGLDLNWDLSFNLSGAQYRWFFEAKGEGFTKYRNGAKHENFKIGLIADKLLQLIGRSDLDIDCWCLFAPYIKLDGNDKRELENIGLHLPFKLVIWDKSILSIYLGSLAPRLFKKTYSKAKKCCRRIGLGQVVSEIKSNSIRGRFQKHIHRNFYILKNDLKNKCERIIIFCKEPIEEKEDNKTIVIDKYFFEYQKAKYFIEKSILDKVNNDLENLTVGTNTFKEPKIDNLKKVLYESKNNGISLFDDLKILVSDKEIPFIKILFLKKIDEFPNLDFVKINSSTHFGVIGNKDILFEKIEDHL